ncbi:MAG: hypothetical protein AAFZ65_13300 [Planctomycetota bacterium]
MMRRLFTKSRLREARQRLAKQPSPLNYALLAQEYALQEDFAEAKRVVAEGLHQFPGSSELESTFKRVGKQSRDARLAVVRQELADAPRDGLHREQIDLLLEGGNLERAQECAEAWCAEADGFEARLALARALAQRFLLDRGRTVGERAFESIESAEELGADDPGLWRLKMELCAAIGCWREARRAAARLLELEPGDPDLEVLFRTYDARSGDNLELRDALREVERTGRLQDEAPEQNARAQASLTRDVRPALRALAHEADVRAALYLRGATALVQGPKGATAERTARQVREVAQSTRTIARRLGLGLVDEIRLEGGFGTLLMSTTEADAAVLWTTHAPTVAHQRALADLSGWKPAPEESLS